ncbi:MAG: hypothetical protein MK102_12265 [Fuerstiella sp.]|nr:hypothetical protein [Fuerstiella sp.]
MACGHGQPLAQGAVLCCGLGRIGIVIAGKVGRCDPAHVQQAVNAYLQLAELPSSDL